MRSTVTVATDDSPAEEMLSPSEEIFSERLVLLIDDILAGRAPNAGRFCGYCYHPVSAVRTMCPHCGRAVAEFPPADNLPREVLDMERTRRRREGLVVRSVAWGGLSVGIAVALLPLIFAGTVWWSFVLFFGLMAFFYLLSANLANSLGDAIGWRWGQSTIRGRWERLVAERDGLRDGH